MEHIKITEELRKNLSVFESFLKNKEREEYLWKPAPEKWCLLEIICHLRDEETEDFRARTKHVLEAPSEPLPSIDPQGWVESRKYIMENYENALNSFLNERKESVEWLQTLSDSGWDNAYDHPKFGKMSAKMFLSNWLAHDYLHFRQITKLKFDYLQYLTSEELTYAGNW
ncbi:MAG: DinB family protein [Ignavibacteria bacterium]|jgi:hypothetical protein|nr:DinB family protein [Ignavibacteria bacterium]